MRVGERGEGGIGGEDGLAGGSGQSQSSPSERAEQQQSRWHRRKRCSQVPLPTLSCSSLRRSPRTRRLGRGRAGTALPSRLSP